MSDINIFNMDNDPKDAKWKPIVEGDYRAAIAVQYEGDSGMFGNAPNPFRVPITKVETKDIDDKQCLIRFEIESYKGMKLTLDEAQVSISVTLETKLEDGTITPEGAPANERHKGVDIACNDIKDNVCIIDKPEWQYNNVAVGISGVLDISNTNPFDNITHVTGVQPDFTWGGTIGGGGTTTALSTPTSVSGTAHTFNLNITNNTVHHSADSDTAMHFESSEDMIRFFSNEDTDERET